MSKPTITFYKYNKVKKALCYNKAMMLLFNIYEYECVILCPHKGIRI